MMEATFFKNNRQKLVEDLQDRALVVLFAGRAAHRSADGFHEFVVNRNFYYVTGIDAPNVIFMLMKKGDKVEETLFIEKAEPVMEKWEGKRMSTEDAAAKSGVERVLHLEDFERQFGLQHWLHDVKHLYLDLEVRHGDNVLTREMTFAKQIRDTYPHVQIENLYRLVANMRRFKSSGEIEKIRKAIEVTNQGIRNMMRNAKPGMKENELEAHFDFTLKMAGVRHHAFHSIVAGGARATVLHYEDNNQLIEDGSLVQIDLGAEWEHYCSDISRAFPINGTFTERQKQIYNIVLKAELEVIKMIKPGNKFSELQETAKRVLGEGLKEIGLIEKDEELAEYYYHGVSHNLGLDTHDVGEWREAILAPGMVLTVEPGLYIAEEGIGIRIEDDVLVTEDGAEVLSQDIPKTVEEIEAFMAASKA